VCVRLCNAYSCALVTGSFDASIVVGTPLASMPNFADFMLVRALCVRDLSHTLTCVRA
jgi:hypothetical protein